LHRWAHVGGPHSARNRRSQPDPPRDRQRRKLGWRIRHTPQLAEELFGHGLDVLTSGNHIWDKREIYDYFRASRGLLRPANYVDTLPGKGVIVVEAHNGVQCAILNLQGRTYMPQTDCPFSEGRRVACRAADWGQCTVRRFTRN